MMSALAVITSFRVTAVMAILAGFPTKKNVDTAIAIADTRLADLADADFDAGLLAATGFVVIGRVT